MAKLWRAASSGLGARPERARAGYIKAPRDTNLAYEFLKMEWRKFLHYGIDFGGRRYNRPTLNPYRDMTSYTRESGGPLDYSP